jgi:protein-serine/threonine kinase
MAAVGSPATGAVSSRAIAATPATPSSANAQSVAAPTAVAVAIAMPRVPHPPLPTHQDKKVSHKSATRRMVGDYIVLKRIGSGSFAQVYKGHHKDDEKAFVAIKQISREKIKTLRLDAHLKSEINILKTVQHQNIVQLFEIVVSEVAVPQ